MESELGRPHDYIPLAPKPRPRVTKEATQRLIVNIAQINAIAFKRNLRDKNHEYFQTSLYEIDRILKDRELLDDALPEETEEQMLYRTVPKAFHDLIHAFSKAASNELPPHRKYDHKIELEKEVPLGYSPLY